MNTRRNKELKCDLEMSLKLQIKSDRIGGAVFLATFYTTMLQHKDMSMQAI